MPARPLTPAALAGWIEGQPPGDWPERAVALVDLDAVKSPDPAGTMDRADQHPVPPSIHAGVTAVVVGTTTDGLDHPWARCCDVLVDPGGADLDAVVQSVELAPLAAYAFAALLRGAPRDTDSGLVLESATYSALQGGPEFAAWLGQRESRDRKPEGDPVRVRRDGDSLRLTLDRPHVRNALNAAMRESLLDALAVAELESGLRVELRGSGPDFCAGGDLDEFGTFADPASAHRLRLERSVARVLDRLRDRTTAHIHGHCAGSGIEIPAFAGRVVADPDTAILLPEVRLGLVPGAGGTVSLPARIGRQRTALLGLTAAPIDAETALAWGLVDEIQP